MFVWFRRFLSWESDFGVHWSPHLDWQFRHWRRRRKIWNWFGISFQPKIRRSRIFFSEKEKEKENESRLRKTNSYCWMWGVFLKSVSLPKQWSFFCFLSQVQKKTSLMKNCFKKHFHLFTWIINLLVIDLMKPTLIFTGKIMIFVSLESLRLP